MAKQKLLVIPEDLAPVMSQSEVDCLCRLQNEIFEDYIKYQNSMTLEEWLDSALVRFIPNFDASAAKQTREQILNTIELNTQNLNSLEEHLKQGYSTNSWFAEQLLKQTKQMNIDDAQKHINTIAQAVEQSNRALFNAVNLRAQLMEQGISVDGAVDGAKAMVALFNRNAAQCNSEYRAVLCQEDESLKLPYGKISIVDANQQVIEDYVIEYRFVEDNEEDWLKHSLYQFGKGNKEVGTRNAALLNDTVNLERSKVALKRRESDDSDHPESCVAVNEVVSIFAPDGVKSGPLVNMPWGSTFGSDAFGPPKYGWNPFTLKQRAVDVASEITANKILGLGVGDNVHQVSLAMSKYPQITSDAALKRAIYAEDLKVVTSVSAATLNIAARTEKIQGLSSLPPPSLTLMADIGVHYANTMRQYSEGSIARSSLIMALKHIALASVVSAGGLGAPVACLLSGSIGSMLGHVFISELIDSELVEHVIDSTKQLATLTVNGVRNTVKAVCNTAKAAVSFVKTTASTIVSGIGKACSSIGSAVANVAFSVASGVGKVCNAVMSFFGGLFG